MLGVVEANQAMHVPVWCNLGRAVSASQKICLILACVGKEQIVIGIEAWAFTPGPWY